MNKNFTSEEALVEQGVVTKQQTASQTQQVIKPTDTQGVTTEDITKGLYGVQNMDPNKPLDKDAIAQATDNLPPEQKKAAEDQQLKAIREKLHVEQHKKTYYDPTFNRPKPEENVSDRLEREEQEKEAMKMEELQEAEKKQPIAVGRAQTKAETNRGVAG